jgi:starvation-inducible DNA-binding protein
MEQLLAQLRMLLADNIALKFKAHGYHWNVESDDFKQFHDFFSDIYEDFDEATDTYAEWLRIFKSYAPYRLTDFFDMATVSEPVIVGDPQPMLSDLYMSIEKHIEDLKNAIDSADANRENGLVDFLSARQTASQKFCWMLRVSMEKPENEVEMED